MGSAGVAVKTIVIATATALVRDRFRAVLESAGHETLLAPSAAELLAAIKADVTKIDLIVLDMQLPPAAGIELIRAIRRIDGGEIPLLIFSGTITSAEEVRALSSLDIAGYVSEHSAPHHILPSLAPHLFPDSFNRRGSPRAALAIPVEYRVGATIAGAVTIDLSHGGLGIRTTNPAAIGSTVQVRFRLPGAEDDIAVDGRAVWSDPRVGMGLQFDAPTPGDRDAIDNFVDAHFFSSRK